MAERRISWIATEGRNYLDYIGVSEVRQESSEVQLMLSVYSLVWKHRMEETGKPQAICLCLCTQGGFFEAGFQAVSP